MASPYSRMARSYGYNYGLLGASIYTQSRHGRVQAQQYRAIRKGNKQAGRVAKPAQIRASMAPRKGDRTRGGVNISGYKRLNKAQRASLNSQQRALYTARRNTVNTRRVNRAIMAGYVAPYAVNAAVKTLGYKNAQGNFVGKKTYVVGGIKRTGSYWTRQGKRANVAIRVPRRVAQGAPARGGNKANGRLMISARSGSRYRRFTQAARTPTFQVRSGGRVRRDYRGRFSGWW